jgi:radical SAM protein with 4Fe4S-binding SPASM domain
LITTSDLNYLASLKPDYIAISLDSLNPQKHEYIRGKSDLAQVIRNIEALLSKNIHVRLNVTLFKGINDGDDDIGELILFSKRRGIKTLIFDTLIPVGRGSKINSHHCEPSVVEKVKRLLKEHSLYDDIPCNSMEGIQVENLSSIDSFLLGKSFCGVGTHSVSILSDAKVAPCPVLRENKYIAGNILEQNLKEIWEKSDVFNCFRKDEVKNIKECKNCEFLSDCKGGCKAKSLLLHGTLSNRDSWICTYYGKMSHGNPP